MNVLSLHYSRRRSLEFVIATSVFGVKKTRAKLSIGIEESERRSNLFSRINRQEVFSHLEKKHSNSIQSREIASGVQRWLSMLTFTALATEPRNDEECGERCELESLHKNCNFSGLVIKGNLYG
jgi:hypothetical protein